MGNNEFDIRPKICGLNFRRNLAFKCLIDLHQCGIGASSIYFYMVTHPPSRCSKDVVDIKTEVAF